jgi:pimeloyl-ACP methyl ester carboxylesterase
MIHNPPADVDCNSCGVVILNPGPTDRNGPERLYFKLAELIAESGYPVLRFDARGVGESEGDWQEGMEGAPVPDVFRRIQEGGWGPDTRAAVDLIIQRTRVERVILGGLCGGAMTALVAGSEHRKVVGFFMIGLPVTLSSAAAHVQNLPESVLSKEANIYFSKLLKPSAWVRLLTLKTDFGTLRDVMLSRIRSRRESNGDSATELGNSKLNPFFVSSYKSAVKGRKKMLFVYSENDYLWHEFKEYILPSFENATPPFDLVTIPHANHNITEVEWQEHLNKALLPWLETCSTEVLPQRR